MHSQPPEAGRFVHSHGRFENIRWLIIAIQGDMSRKIASKIEPFQVLISSDRDDPSGTSIPYAPGPKSGPRVKSFDQLRLSGVPLGACGGHSQVTRLHPNSLFLSRLERFERAERSNILNGSPYSDTSLPRPGRASSMLPDRYPARSRATYTNPSSLSFRTT